jgi:DnaJ-domain-containing protein 1
VLDAARRRQVMAALADGYNRLGEGATLEALADLRSMLELIPGPE